MKLTLAITLDGLVRAMRWKEHDLAEQAQREIARRKSDRATTARTDRPVRGAMSKERRS